MKLAQPEPSRPVRCRQTGALPTGHKPRSLTLPQRPRKQIRQVRKRLARRLSPGHRVSGNCGEARIGGLYPASVFVLVQLTACSTPFQPAGLAVWGPFGGLAPSSYQSVAEAQTTGARWSDARPACRAYTRERLSEVLRDQTPRQQRGAQPTTFAGHTYGGGGACHRWSSRLASRL